ncbi:MAG: glycerophosphodiester phosphodiesterase family protein [Verrucomicrobiales bacterium]|nr:glycerophosphodiester phosphodiesterase family protein [Verrucomicrobiales bacterium]
MNAENTAKAAEPSSPVETLINLHRPIVIGHRGYNQIAPENTLPSFKLAKMAGADMVELDYYNAKDGKLVCIHDEVLDRTTDAVAKWGEKGVHINSKTSDELCSLDAGKWFDKKNAGSHLPIYAGTHLPTLDESLDLIQDGNLTLIHHKEGDAATCLKLLREKNLVNKVIVQSFDWNYLKDFHQLEPNQVLGALGPLWSRGGKQLTNAEKVLDQSWVDEVKSNGARLVVWNNQITREAVDYAHQHGMKVWVYTINEPAMANKMLDLGADGIITDNTSIIWRAIALRATEKGLPR